MKLYRHLIQSCFLFCLIIGLPIQAHAKLQAEKGSYLVLSSPPQSGFFALFATVLGALHLYENGYYAGVEVNYDTGLYLDPEKGPNWWEYFFEPICVGDTDAASYVFSLQDFVDLTPLGLQLPRKRAAELIQKYIHIKPELQQEVDDYAEKHFKDYFVIGIHHRGTDKKTEMPLIPYEKTLQTLNWLIANLHPSLKNKVRIYIATDEDRFLKYMLDIYPSLIIYNDFARSVNEDPLHYNDCFYSSNYQKGKEALIDCLLLSKTNWMLYPGNSSLSTIALKINPNLPKLDLNQ